MSGFLHEVWTMDRLRKVEWVLMVVMIAAFFKAADAAAVNKTALERAEWRGAVEVCGVDPCRVPERVRPDTGRDCSESGWNRTVPGGNVTLKPLPPQQ